jgi:monoamine oxidase
MSDTHSLDGIYKEVVIIGAGLAGLQAAYMLRDRETLVLEREQSAGGRVLTRFWQGIPYDLGAVFAFEPVLLPAGEVCPALIEERGMVGAHVAGKIWMGANVASCLGEIDFRNEELAEITAFVTSGAEDLAALSPGAYRLLNAFFQLIHPGEMSEYLPQRRLDAFFPFQIAHYETGNGALVASFIRQVFPLIRHGAVVQGVEEASRGVRIRVNEMGKDIELHAKVVICAAPAPDARQMLAHQAAQCKRFLEKVRYGSGSVTVLSIPGDVLPQLSYLATPELATSAIVRHQAANGNALLYLYCMGSKAAVGFGRSPGQRQDDVLQILKSLGLARDQMEQIHIVDHHHWEQFAPVISREIYAGWSEENLHPSPRVVLAGDYTHVNPHHPMPYGMSAAITSGKKAALAARLQLDNAGAL